MKPILFNIILIYKNLNKKVKSSPSIFVLDGLEVNVDGGEFHGKTLWLICVQVNVF
jgi:hypothetical protein